MSFQSDVVIMEITDERSSFAEAALALFASTFDPRDQHQVADLRSEIAEKRLGLLAPFDFHLLVAGRHDALLGGIIGVYLAGVNAGFVSYLAVVESCRGSGIGRVLRAELVAHFRADARRNGHQDLAWVLGEVRADNPWLQRLVRQRGAIPFNLTYYHPGMFPGTDAPRYVLYAQPVSDKRAELPSGLLAQIVYAIYRRAYRVRYPLQHAGFAAMLKEIVSSPTIGADPGFEQSDSN